jgi:hypothetical protein
VIIGQPASVCQFNYSIANQKITRFTIEPENDRAGNLDFAAQHTRIDVFSDPDEKLLASGWPYQTPRAWWYSPAEVRPTGSGAFRVKLLVRSDRHTNTPFTVKLIGRAFTGADGTTPAGGVVMSCSVENTVGSRYPIPFLASGSHVMTAMRPGGSVDTVLLLINENQDTVWQYDDDNGPGMMSWMHIARDFNLGDDGYVLVGNITSRKSVTELPAATPKTPVTVLWDEDVHNGRDADKDGLGDALEAQLGTDPGNKDSDSDGISDVLEVLGMADDPKHETNPDNTLLFPAYGAVAANQKDVFVEVDWEPACFDSDPTCSTNGGPIDKNGNQYHSAIAAVFQTLFSNHFETPLSIHLDTGDPLCSPPERCGAWGGGRIYPDDFKSGNYCDNLTPERIGYFHHIRSGGGWQTASEIVRGSRAFPRGVGINCSKAGPAAPRAAVHELGHQFGLEHYGSDDGAKDKVGGCKPHYQSMMTYVYQDNTAVGDIVPAFSHGDNMGIVMNPTTLDETNWTKFSPAAQAVIQQQSTFFRAATANGIDWNMDGHVATAAEQSSQGNPKGPLNYTAGYHSCDRAPYAVRQTGWVMQAKNPTLVAGKKGLWTVARGDKQLYFAKVDHTRCAKQGTTGCTDFTQSTGVTVSQATGPFAPAAAGDILVYASPAKTGGYSLYYMKGMPWNADKSSSVSAAKAVGGPVVTGQPVATVDPKTGIVSVYAASGVGPSWTMGLVLSRWDYDPKTSTWTRLGEPQLDENGAQILIDPKVAPAITRGYQSGGLVANESQEEYVYLFYQEYQGSLHLTRQATTRTQVTLSLLGRRLTFTIATQFWKKFPDAVLHDLTSSLAIPGDTFGLGASRLGLAFKPEPQPTDAGTGTFVTGRFYFAFTGGGDMGQQNMPMISFTKGNTYWDGASARPAERELAFAAFNNFANQWTDIPDGITLAYFDGNVRAVAQMDITVKIPEVFDPGKEKRFSPPSTSYFPNADGVYNMDQHDYNDQALIIKNLKTSLTRAPH